MSSFPEESLAGLVKREYVLYIGRATYSLRDEDRICFSTTKPRQIATFRYSRLVERVHSWAETSISPRPILLVLEKTFWQE